MGFLTGKTAIITGAGRAVLKMEAAAPSAMESPQLMPKRVQTLLSLVEI